MTEESVRIAKLCAMRRARLGLIQRRISEISRELDELLAAGDIIRAEWHSLLEEARRLVDVAYLDHGNDGQTKE